MRCWGTVSERNQPGNDSVVWTLYENHGNDVIDGNSCLPRSTGKNDQKRNLPGWTSPTKEAANAPYFTQTRSAA